MIMQILVGVFLEMQQEGWQGSFRVMTVYFSGVIAGSLGTSLSDPQTYIAGKQTDKGTKLSLELQASILDKVEFFKR